MDADVAVVKRADGIWVVILARRGSAPMEFVCESEDQARGFAASLSQPPRPSRPREDRQGSPGAGGWFRRWGKAG